MSFLVPGLSYILSSGGFGGLFTKKDKVQRWSFEVELAFESGLWVWGRN